MHHKEAILYYKIIFQFSILKIYCQKLIDLNEFLIIICLLTEI